MRESDGGEWGCGTDQGVEAESGGADCRGMRISGRLGIWLRICMRLPGATLAAGATVAVATGIAMEFPSTHGALVEDRSGLAVRGVTTLAGVIDPGYRGEIKVVMTNLSAAAVEIKAGDRIAQLRIVQRIEAQFEEVTRAGGGCAGGEGVWQHGR